MIHEFCDKLQIPFEKISSEDFSAFLRILSLSKHAQKPQQHEGKGQAAARPMRASARNVSGSEKPSNLYRWTAFAHSAE